MPARSPDTAERAFRTALAAVGDNQSAFARICGCTQGAVWQMLNKPSPRLSVQFVLKVEGALGIPRHLLRPDIYPAPDGMAAEAVPAEAA